MDFLSVPEVGSCWHTHSTSDPEPVSANKLAPFLSRSSGNAIFFVLVTMIEACRYSSFDLSSSAAIPSAVYILTCKSDFFGLVYAWSEGMRIMGMVLLWGMVSFWRMVINELSNAKWPGKQWLTISKGNLQCLVFHHNLRHDLVRSKYEWKASIDDSDDRQCVFGLVYLLLGMIESRNREQMWRWNPRSPARTVREPWLLYWFRPSHLSSESTKNKKIESLYIFQRI